MASTKLLSCLMVTRPTEARLAYVKRSIADYIGQTWAAKELVIVVDPRAGDGAQALIDHVAALRRSDLRIVTPSRAASLGALRNRGVSEASGDVLCQWDDDDLHHPERMAAQFAAMTHAGRKACYLQDVVQFLVAPRQLYWTNWLRTAGQALPGTMMCERSLAVNYPETGREADMGEDSQVLDDLRRDGLVHTMVGQPHLYVYVTHGYHHATPAHHRMLVDRLSLSNGLIRRREAQIRAGLSGFDFGSEPVAMMGSGGAVFHLRTERPV